MSTSSNRDSEAGASSPRERVMGFWDHLDELRGTLIKSATVFLLFVALTGYYLAEFNRVLMAPFHRITAEYPMLSIELGTITPMEGMGVLLQMCMLGSLLLSAPFVLFFIGQFVAPALTPKEMKAVLPMCVSAFGLFLAGSAFGFFVLLPSAVRVMIEINLGFDWAFRWTVGSYYQMLNRLVLGVGAAFQFPLVIVLLAWLGLVTTDLLRRYRRHAIVAIFIVAAIVTPSTEPLSQTLLAAPLYLLYEVAIILAARVERRRERSATLVVIALLALLPQKRNATRGVRLGTA